MAEETKKEEKKEEETSQEESTESTEENVEVPEKFQELVSKIEEMSVLELSELVKVLEKKFGVSSAAPVAAVGAAAGGEEEGGGEEESSTATVELTEAGDNKIGVIKALREVTELGLKDAKDMVEGAPQTVKEDAPKEEAEEIKTKLEEAGAKVTLK